MVDRVYFTVIFLLILGAGGYFVYDRIQALRENVQILKTNAEVMNNSLKESNETIVHPSTGRKSSCLLHRFIFCQALCQ